MTKISVRDENDCICSKLTLFTKHDNQPKSWTDPCLVTMGMYGLQEKK